MASAFGERTGLAPALVDTALRNHGRSRARRSRITGLWMDPRAWSVLDDWTSTRTAFWPGPLFCVIDGPTRGRAWSDTVVRTELRDEPAPEMPARRVARFRILSLEM